MKTFSLAIVMALFLMSCGEKPKKPVEEQPVTVQEPTQEKVEIESPNSTESEDSYLKYLVRNSYFTSRDSGNIWPVSNDGVMTFYSDLDMKDIPRLGFDSLGLGGRNDKKLHEITIGKSSYLYWIYSLPIEVGTENCLRNIQANQNPPGTFIQDLPCTIPTPNEERDTVTLVVIIPQSLMAPTEDGGSYLEYGITMMNTRTGNPIKVKKKLTKSGGK